jgi:hypothetical protein
MTKITEVRIFYSWQSDSPKKTNLNAIRAALDIAATKIAGVRSDLKIVPDEATRDTSGSPNIALKILEKVEAADVFVADVTTITPPGSPRPCPNPNVVYELGYAVGQLGWDRVILLFNKALGNFPGDLPFDFVQHRCSPYTLTVSEPNAARGKLADLLEMAITAVIDKNPKRPAELRGLSREKLEHDHDVENMEWLMSSIHLPTLDEHILDLPRRISDRDLWFFEKFDGVVRSSLFSVYDPVLKAAVDRLFHAWHIALSHSSEYDETPGGRIHVFSSPMDLPLPRKRQLAWDEIDNARTEMRKAIDEILGRLREGYIEVKIHDTNAKAWKDYVAVEAEVRQMLHPKPKPKKARKLKK